MGLDTKYRPIRYDDVLGQEAAIKICREYVKAKRGFQQSYVFYGPYGSGKTTMGRIFARALLCQQPQDGEACDTCVMCRTMLESRCASFVEVDAATHSGKDDIKKILEDVEYGAFSGSRILYLVDECFTEDTMVVTPEGPRSIRDLVEQRYQGMVASFDGQTPRWKPVTNWYEIARDRECSRLEFDNGLVLVVTQEQEIFTKVRGWVSSSSLSSDECVVGMSLGYDPQTTPEPRLVRRTAVGKQKVYDISVADTHSFFAFSNLGAQDSAVLVHNCHELSRQAMDALLKPLEDTYPSSLDKLLVCIFCTTEPDKMRPAIISRCAPTFRIHPNDPAQIAKRLAHVCAKETIFFDDITTLELIAEVKECHIRDCLKAVESLSLLHEGVTLANVRSYLHLGIQDQILTILRYIDAMSEEGKVVEALQKIEHQISPSSAYARLAEACLMAYKLAHFQGVVVPSYVDAPALGAVGKKMGIFLLQAAKRFGERPYRSTHTMLACDVFDLALQRAMPAQETGAMVFVPPPSAVEEKKESKEPGVTGSGVYVLPAAQKTSQVVKPSQDSVSMDAFVTVFVNKTRELGSEIIDERLSGQPHVGGDGTDPTGVQFDRRKEAGK